MIESILENRPWAQTTLSDTVTTTNGSTALVGVGGNFVAELASGDIITLIDDTGVFRTYMIDSVTDGTNAVLQEAAVSAATGVAASKIDTVDQTVAFFKADNSVVKQPIIAPGGDGNYLLADNNAVSQFSVNEGVLIKSIFARFPFQYPMSDTPLTVGFVYLDDQGVNQGAMTTPGENGSFSIPNENIEVPVNIYVPPLANNLTTNTWQISAKFEGAPIILNPANPNLYTIPSVSQVDGPDILNSLYLPVYIGIRILHGFALT